jgi:hypothetical protein
MPEVNLIIPVKRDIKSLRRKPLLQEQHYYMKQFLTFLPSLFDNDLLHCPIGQEIVQWQKPAIICFA